MMMIPSSFLFFFFYSRCLFAIVVVVLTPILIKFGPQVQNQNTKTACECSERGKWVRGVPQNPLKKLSNLAHCARTASPSRNARTRHRRSLTDFLLSVEDSQVSEEKKASFTDYFLERVSCENILIHLYLIS